MKFNNVKSLKFGYLALFFGILVSMFFFLNNSAIINENINDKGEYLLIPKISSSNVTIISPETDVYGPNPLVINVSIYNDTALTKVVANVNSSLIDPFNLTMSHYFNEYWNCSWYNITDSAYPSGEYNITIIAIDSEPSVNQSQHVVIIIDKDNPSVSIIHPGDGSQQYNNGTIDINATITDLGGGVSKAIAIISNSSDVLFNLTMSKISGTDNWTATWDNTSLYSEGSYNIIIRAVDVSDKENQTEMVNFTLHDVLSPSVIIYHPGNGSFQYNNGSFYINATINDLGSIVSNATAIISNSSGILFNLIMSNIPGTNNWTATWSNTSLYQDGNYYITIRAVDISGNVNQSQWIVITLNDVLSPSVLFYYPGNGSDQYNNGSIYINATITDLGSGVSNATAIISNSSGILFNLIMSKIPGTNNWTATWSNTSLYLDGNYNITIRAADIIGNVNQSQWITIMLNDLLGPRVLIYYPGNGSNQDINSTIVIIASVVDPGSGVSNVTAIISNSSDVLFYLDMSIISGTNNWTATWNNASLYIEGIYNITIWTIDNRGNVNNTVFHMINLEDRIKPSVEIYHPGNGSDQYNNGSIYINATITDLGSGVSNVTAIISNSSGILFNLIMSYIPGTNNWTATWSNTSLYLDGNYNITIRAVDISGNVNQSQLITITLNDVLSPSVSNIIPSGGSIDNDQDIAINVTINDLGSGVSNVTAIISNSSGILFNLTMTIIPGTINWTTTWSNTSQYAEGTYKITIRAVDIRGNFNQTQWITLTLIDVLGPNVLIYNPGNGSNQDINSTIVIIVSVVDPGCGVSNVTAIISNSSEILFNLTMSRILGTNNWTVEWSNMSQYSEGEYNITIWAIDNKGYINSTEFVIFTLTDGIRPSVSNIYPSGGSFDNNQDIYINATILDLGSGVHAASAIINVTGGFLNLTMKEETGRWTVTWTNTSEYAEGSYIINIWAIDGAGNINSSESVIISLNDVLNPRVSNIVPSGVSIGNDQDIEINATISDPGSGVSAASVIINVTGGFLNLTMKEEAGKWIATWTNSISYAEGIYSITIWAIDGAGNINSSESVINTLNDVLSPIINFENPQNNTIKTNIFNITAEVIDISDPTEGNVIAMIYNETGSNILNLTMIKIIGTNNWIVEWYNLSAYNYGNYSISIRAIDSSTNKNFKATSNITIWFYEDLTPPNIVYSPEYDNAENTGDAFIIYVNITDDYSFPRDGDVMIQIVKNPVVFNDSMHYLEGNMWYYQFKDLSSLDNGEYKFRIWARDSSLTGNSTYILISFRINIPRGGIDLFSIIMIVIIGIAVVVAGFTFFVIKKRDHNTRFDEIDRIERLTGESLCERCEYFDADEKFCNKLLVIKRFDLNASCKEYKRKSIAPAIEKVKEEFESKIYEPVPGTMCETCQNYNYNTGLCDKYLTFPQLKPNQFCKGYKKFKENGEKGKLFIKDKISTVKLFGEELCTACQYQELDTGFCKKYLTYKKLKPTESCKGFKKKKETAENQE